MLIQCTNFTCKLTFVFVIVKPEDYNLQVYFWSLNWHQMLIVVCKCNKSCCLCYECQSLVGNKNSLDVRLNVPFDQIASLELKNHRISFVFSTFGITVLYRCTLSILKAPFPLLSSILESIHTLQKSLFTCRLTLNQTHSGTFYKLFGNHMYSLQFWKISVDCSHSQT